MTRRSIFSLFLLVTWLAAVLFPLGAGRVAAGEPVRYVRIQRSAQDDFSRLGIFARLTVDYGSFTWLELDEAEYDRLAASSVKFWDEPSAAQVSLPGYRFDPISQGEPPVPPASQSDEARPGFRLVQFVGPVKDEWLGALGRLGLRLLQYYPSNAYLVWGDSAQTDRAARLPFTRWTGLFHPAYKVSPDLARFSGPIENLDVMIYDDGSLSGVLDQIRSLGGEILQVYPSQPDRAFFDAIVRLDAPPLDQIARIPAVLWIGAASPRPVLDDEMSDQIVAGNAAGGIPAAGYQAWLEGRAVDGSGVTWAVIDTGVDYDHPDLGTHIVGGYNFPGACVETGEPGTDCLGGGHGTHVAGILGGDASAGFADAGGFLYGLGVAPGSGVFAMNSLSGTSWPPAGGWQEHSRQAVLGGAVGGNNSWATGEGINVGYQSSERTHDLIVRDGNFDTAAIAEPFIEVFSAGNSGPGSNTLTSPKEAKNLVVVASSKNYRAGSIDAISSFSSRGPTVDGRYVPTLAAPGEEIASTRNDLGGECAVPIPGTDNLYAFCSGTSMAAPHTSGALALVTQWWRGFNGGANPSPAMAKALLVNGAVDIGAPDIPNFEEGWGRIHLEHVIAPDAHTEYLDQSVILHSPGDTWTMTVGVVDPSKPLKISLVWTDAPGAVGANPALVNNLDLSVVSGSVTYLGNRFSAGWSVSGGAPDAINNLENVYLADPADTAVITVQAASLPGDGIPYTADQTDQDFALVCYNCADNADFTLAASPVVRSICAPQPASYDVAVGSLLGYTDRVALSAVLAPSSPLTSTFSPSDAVPPFTSTLVIGNTSAASPGSYTLAVQGVAPTSTHTATLALDLFNAIPLAPALLTPPSGSGAVPLRPQFAWSAPPQATAYDLEVALDSAFSTLVISETGLAIPSFTPAVDLLTNTTYYWRVRAGNACGSGSFSQSSVFTTVPAPGQCPVGTLPISSFNDDFESGAASWTHSGVGDTWAVAGDRTHSGVSAFHAVDPTTISDQRLESPVISLPAGASPLTLQFWNYQSLEDYSNGCYDGALLEISQDGGLTWTQLQNQVMLTDPYDGPVHAYYSNPLAGLDSWCGDPQDWLSSVVNLDAYAGQDVQFRFRLGSDASVGREGWYIDDVLVQGCHPTIGVQVAPDLLSRSGLPGEVITFTYQVTNTGISPDTYSLAVSGNRWPVYVAPTTGEIAPGAAAQVDVAVSLPLGPPPEAIRLIITDTFSLTAASKWVTTVSDSASGLVSLDVQPALELGADQFATGFTGQSLVFTVPLTNTGNYADIYDLTVSGDWPASLSSPSTGQVLPGQSVLLFVTVGIPSDAPDGALQVTDITAVSRLDGSVSASASIATSALRRRLYFPIVER